MNQSIFSGVLLGDVIELVESCYLWIAYVMKVYFQISYCEDLELLLNGALKKK